MPFSEENVLELALSWANNRYPTESWSHKCAFANSVEYLVLGYVGGYGGPSVRQIAIDYAVSGFGNQDFALSNFGEIVIMFPVGKLPNPGNWQFESAVEFCAKVCFGSITDIHRLAWLQQGGITFDNDPEDVKVLLSKVCIVCNKSLSPSAKRQYCKQHRHLDPIVKDRVKNWNKKNKGIKQ